MSKNYDLVGRCEFWSDKDLVDYLIDVELSMSLEKHELAALAQELARRYQENVSLEEEDDDLEYND